MRINARLFLYKEKIFCDDSGYVFVWLKSVDTQNNQSFPTDLRKVAMARYLAHYPRSCCLFCKESTRTLYQFLVKDDLRLVHPSILPQRAHRMHCLLRERGVARCTVGLYSNKTVNFAYKHPPPLIARSIV